jgi:hypothetical protein
VKKHPIGRASAEFSGHATALRCLTAWGQSVYFKKQPF